MRRDLLIAAVAGATAVAGFAPFHLFPLAIAAVVILMALWERASNARQAFALGFAFGFGFFITGVSWVYVSLHDFGFMPAPLAALATLLFCGFLALSPAAVGALQAWLGVSRITKRLIVIPAAWVLAEVWRATIFTGFPWLELGYSQIDTPLAGYAPVLGVYSLSLLMMMVAGLLLSIPRQKFVAIGAIAAIYIVGFMLARIEWTSARAAPIKVALLQGNIPQDLKFVEGRFESIAATYLKLIEASEAKLIVLPETALPRFIETVDPQLIERFKAYVAAKGGDMLIGAPVGNPRGAYYNAVVSVGASPTQVYAKSHLVPFGEFVPPGFGWIVSILHIPLSDFTRGPPTQAPLAVAGERVAVNICYEDVFGREIIRQLPQATMLANVSNVAWFGDSLAPAQHLQISRMRAIETGRSMIRATNTGVTAVVDQKGRVLEALPTFSEGALVHEVMGFEGATPYVRYGDWPILILAALALLFVLFVLFALGLKRRKSR